jgi:large subunit ribosomal protein L32
MAVPKRRSSNSRTGRRRAHKHLTAKNLAYCAKCSTALPTHVVCPNCGYYMGRTVVNMDTKAGAAEAE